MVNANGAATFTNSVMAKGAYAVTISSQPNGQTCLVSDGAGIVATGDRLNLKVAQLPFVAGERWVGLPTAAGQTVAAGKLSLVVQCPATALDTTQALAGLWVDEWTEVVPSATEYGASAPPFRA